MINDLKVPNPKIKISRISREKFDIVLDDIKQVHISYQLINLSNSCQYSFLNNNLDIKDYQIYFKKTFEICSNEFCSLCDTVEHFHLIDDPSKCKNLLKILKKIFNDYIPPFMAIGQFPLYTSQNELANRDENIKSPRVFYWINPENHVMYILFIDLYHEIYPAKKKH